MKSLYFSHDFDSRTDIKIRNLIRSHGMTGYGIYWALVEDLYRNANAMRTHYDLYAFEMRVEEDVIRSVINDFDLFNIDGDTFSSDSVERRINDINERSSKASTSAKHRWNKEESERNANVMRTHSDSNANKNKNKNKIVFNTTTTTTTNGADAQILEPEEIQIEDDYDTDIKEYFFQKVPAGDDPGRAANHFIKLNDIKNWQASGGKHNWRAVADLYIERIPEFKQKKGRLNGNGSQKGNRISFTDAIKDW